MFSNCSAARVFRTDEAPASKRASQPKIESRTLRKSATFMISGTSQFARGTIQIQVAELGQLQFAVVIEPEVEHESRTWLISAPSASSHSSSMTIASSLVRAETKETS